jgi:hypothetical protein
MFVVLLTVVVDVLMGRRVKWEERRRRRGRRVVDGKKLSARMTSETTRTKIVEGVLWKMRGSIEKFVSSSRSGVMEGSKAASRWGVWSDDDCGNGGALIFREVNDSRHLPKNSCAHVIPIHQLKDLLRYNAYGVQRRPTMESR